MICPRDIFESARMYLGTFSEMMSRNRRLPAVVTTTVTTVMTVVQYQYKFKTWEWEKQKQKWGMVEGCLRQNSRLKRVFFCSNPLGTVRISHSLTHHGENSVSPILQGHRIPMVQIPPANPWHPLSLSWMLTCHAVWGGLTEELQQSYYYVLVSSHVKRLGNGCATV